MATGLTTDLPVITVPQLLLRAMGTTSSQFKGSGVTGRQFGSSGDRANSCSLSCAIQS